jgi:DNA-binding transcriptional LysR family regulator
MRDLQTLIPFVQTVRTGSFVAAAAALQVTPPAISKAIARLEAELGVRLFNRTTRRVRLTAEGEMFYGRIGALLAGLDDAVSAVTSAGREPRGLVRVSVTPTFGRHCVLPLMAGFCSRYPDVKVEFSFDEVPPSLVDGGFDVRILHARSRETSYMLRTLCDYPIILVAHPDYLRRRNVPRAPEELARHDCIGIRLSSGLAAWPLFLAANAAGRQSPTESFLHHPNGPVTVAAQGDATLALCLLGGGIAASSVPVVLPYLDAGTLKVVLPEYRLLTHQGRRQQVFIQFPHREHLSMKVRVFMDYLTNCFHSQDYAAINLSVYAM